MSIPTQQHSLGSHTVYGYCYVDMDIYVSVGQCTISIYMYMTVYVHCVVCVQQVTVVQSGVITCVLVIVHCQMGALEC